jgi:hypothetical protein
MIVQPMVVAKKNLGNGKQMCKKHQQMYDEGKPFKVFYGKIALKKEFQSETVSSACV